MISETTLLYWLIPLLIWDAIWKGIALWHSARNNQPRWFVVLLIVSSVGILPMIYLQWFQKKLTV